MKKLLPLFLAGCLPLLACDFSVPATPAKSGAKKAVVGKKKAAPKKAAAPVKVAPWKVDMTKDCPGNAPSSELNFASVEGGYTLVVTDSDASKAKEIRANSLYLARASEEAEDPVAALKFPGVTGDRATACSVVLEGTKIVYAEADGGASLTVTAKNPKQVGALRQKAEQKVAERNEKAAIFK